jgi:hypothetical protein
MFDTMIADLLRRRPTPFIVRNRYAVEMKAAEIIEGAQEYFMNFLIRDYENRLADMTEPFIGMRRIVEDILKKSVMLGLIPPIATDLNGTANYYLIRGEYDTNHKTSTDNKKGPIENTKYRMRLRWMHPTIANSLRYIVGVVQDGSHSNGELVLDVDRYFKEAQDVLLLRSVAYLLMDVVKCFAVTAVKNPNKEDNVQKFWYIAPPEVPVVNPFATGE